MQELLKTLDNFILAGVDELVQDKTNDLSKPKNLVHIAPDNMLDKKKSQNLMPNKENLLCAAIPTNQLVIKAKNLASKANNLAELEEILKNFDGCALAKTAKNLVFSDGNEKSDLVVIGEAPGAMEDEKGIPFCGVSGKLLDDIFRSIQHSRASNIYITNSIFWRPPGNRRPTDEEIAICRPFVEKHIALKNPKLIILVGSTALNSILPEISQTISKVRGSFMKYKNPYLVEEINITAIFHPSYLLRQPGKKAIMWQDMLKIKKFLKG